MASAISCITNHAILPDYSAAKSVTLKYFLKYILPFNNLTIRPSLLKSYYIHEKENSAEAADISNRIAPEHLELFIERPFELLKKIRNAGAIFLGRNTPESLGDYMA
ncbi:MAG: histidinol dehydrogenase, partial [Deltaproteobacteria bacterium]|nr:histidinol dehydrogenase [Deltaproteobacteria bacterium]